MSGESILGKHGGYRQLRGFQVAQMVYDITVRFCERYIDRFSRTRDQMVQAARSGVQNIAEGSEAAATSKKTELKLTQVARASLEELKLDYEDFLRQHGLPQWDRHHPLRQRLVEARPQTADAVAAWVKEVARETPDDSRPTPSPTGSTRSTGSTSLPFHPLYAELSANAALTLVTVAGYLLDRHLQALSAAFEREGGFTERLYRVRSRSRQQQPSGPGGPAHG